MSRLVSWIMNKVKDNCQKKYLLEKYGWYPNMHGGFTHPHAMDYMSFREVAGYSVKELKYKLRHGSMAELPKGES